MLPDCDDIEEAELEGKLSIINEFCNFFMDWSDDKSLEIGKNVILIEVQRTIRRRGVSV